MGGGEVDDFVCDYHLEMLSLSQDQQNPVSIQFDDLSWQGHLSSLKPLGLNILLNLCNGAVTQQLCRFSDHLSDRALRESHGAVRPVHVPWGLCELSRLIGEGWGRDGVDVTRLIGGGIRGGAMVGVSC